jgi:hypothetical protein
LAEETEVVGENLPRRHLVHHKFHLPDPGANPGRRGEKPATKRFSYGAAKTNVVGLQNFLRDKLPIWGNNSSCVEDIWNNFKDIAFEGIERFVPHKILKQNPDPEYYNKEVKRLEVKARRA